MKPDLTKIEILIDAYEKLRQEQNMPFIYFEKEDILRAVKEVIEKIKS